MAMYNPTTNFSTSGPTHENLDPYTDPTYANTDDDEILIVKPARDIYPATAIILNGLIEENDNIQPIINTTFVDKRVTPLTKFSDYNFTSGSQTVNPKHTMQFGLDQFIDMVADTGNMSAYIEVGIEVTDIATGNRRPLSITDGIIPVDGIPIISNVFPIINEHHVYSAALANDMDQNAQGYLIKKCNVNSNPNSNERKNLVNESNYHFEEISAADHILRNTHAYKKRVESTNTDGSIYYNLNTWDDWTDGVRYNDNEKEAFLNTPAVAAIVEDVDANIDAAAAVPKKALACAYVLNEDSAAGKRLMQICARHNSFAIPAKTFTYKLDLADVIPFNKASLPNYAIHRIAFELEFNSINKLFKMDLPYIEARAGISIQGQKNLINTLGFRIYNFYYNKNEYSPHNIVRERWKTNVNPAVYQTHNITSKIDSKIIPMGAKEHTFVVTIDNKEVFPSAIGIEFKLAADEHDIAADPNWCANPCVEIILNNKLWSKQMQQQTITTPFLSGEKELVNFLNAGTDHDADHHNHYLDIYKQKAKMHYDYTIIKPMQNLFSHALHDKFSKEMVVNQNSINSGFCIYFKSFKINPTGNVFLQPEAAYAGKLAITINSLNINGFETNYKLKVNIIDPITLTRFSSNGIWASSELPISVASGGNVQTLTTRAEHEHM